MNANFSCILIGESTLLIQCARILKTAGIEIAAVLSPTTDIQKWAQAEKLPCHAGYHDLAHFIGSFEYDYLLSIVNSAILPVDVLNTARVAAINYHDGPLPRYAGVYATTWALLNGETAHAISWHLMTEKADEGDLLVQEPVVIEPQDTVYTLNTRCYEAAIHAFEKLLPQLITGQLQRHSQDLTRRTYFSLYQRPNHAGFLQFNRPTGELVNLVRSLTYDSRHDNLFLAAKVWIDQRCYIVVQASAEPKQDRAAAGELLEIGEKGLRIATIDGSVRITELTDLSGRSIAISQLQALHFLRPKQTLPFLESSLLSEWSKQQSLLSRYEKFWSKKLRQFFKTTSSPMLTADKLPEPADEFLEFSPVIRHRLQALAPSRIVAALHLFLSGLYFESIRVGLCHEGSMDPVLGPHQLTADTVPLVLDYKRDFSPSEFNANDQEVQSLLDKKTFQRELLARLLDVPKDGDIEYDYVIYIGEAKTTHHPAFAGIQRLLWVNSNGIGFRSRVDASEKVRLFLTRCNYVLNQILFENWVLIKDISLLLPQEQLSVDDTIRPETANDHDWPAHILFSRRAEMHPERVALVQQHKAWSYGELEQKANQIARAIKRQVDANVEIIAVCVDRSPEMIAVVLGILKAGSAYLPLASNLPQNRLAGILLDARVELTITSRKNAERFKGLHTVCLEVEELCQQPPDADCFGEQDIDVPAYVIYTSGSTGKPKGVVIGHRALAGFIHHCLRRYRISENDRMLQFSSLAFDASIEEIFPVLSCGGTLVLRTEEMISSIPTFLRECESLRITVLDLPTAFWSLTLSVCEQQNLHLPESVRLVLIGGENAAEAMFAAWKRQYSTYPRLINSYGPTETTVVVTAFEYNGQWTEPYLPIGKMADHSQSFLLNSFGQLLPPDYIGELYIAGDCLAHGYLHHEELTKQAFLELTLAGRVRRLYKTGDLVKRLVDGNLVFIGRKDKQVKIRGFRIEIEEILSGLAALPEVKDCTVIDYGQGADKKLAAYVVFQHTPLNTEQVRERLADVLPDYMLPSVVIPLDVIPLSISMKVDTRALPDPSRFEQTTDTSAYNYSSLEERLKPIWERVMKRSAIGPEDNFFALGGDSLTAVMLMTEIEKELGRNLPISVVLHHGTIRQLAALIESKDEEDKWRPLVTIQKGTGKIPLFIIHGAGLNVLLFNTLTQYMHPDQPIYGLQARQSAKSASATLTVEDIVTSYYEEIMTVTTEGPFALAGFSLGGQIAYELAQRLVRNKKKVIFVGIFDTYAGIDEPVGSGLGFQLQRITLILKKSLFAVQTLILYPSEALPLRCRWLRHYFANIIKRKKLKKYEMDIAHLPEKIAIMAAKMVEAIDRHTFLPYPGRIHLFRAQHRLFYVSDKKYLGWKKYVSDIKIYDIPGDHSYIFAPPNDVKFAEMLQKALDEEAQAFSLPASRLSA